MGDAEHQLFYIWQVDRAFRNNLSKIEGTKKSSYMQSSSPLLIAAPVGTRAPPPPARGPLCAVRVTGWMQSE